MLAKLPVELLRRVQSFLNRNDLASLSITCRYIHGATLPPLYKHLELGYYRHIRQLQEGVTSQPVLKQVIYENTRKLTLISRQNGNNWRVQDLMCILGISSRIEELTFCDFGKLSTQTIQQVVSMLPNIRHVQFKYCHIVNNSKQQPFGESIQDVDYSTSDTSSSINGISALSKVSYVWTDFTERSVKSLLFPQITQLELGSNRNKYDLINDHMVQSLYVHCPKITHLTVNLPQVGHKALCDTITQYGKQLTYLSIQCDHFDILRAIATHAINIQSLVVRATFASPSSRNNSMEEHMIGVMKVIEHCNRLEYFEIISCDMENYVPLLVWESCLLSSNSELRCKAQAVILKKSEHHQESDIVPRSRTSTRGSVWFFTVTEEALEQRYHYMNRVGLRQKNDTLSNYTNLILHKPLLDNVKKQMKLLNEGCGDQIDEEISSVPGRKL